MSGFFGEDEFLCDLEEEVCAATYAEGMSGLGMTSQQRVAAENRQWAGIKSLQSKENKMGLTAPSFSVGAGGSDKVKGEDGQWRQATQGEQDQMKAGTFDPKKTAQSRYQSQGGHVGAETKQSRMDRETMQQAGAYGQQSMRPGFNVPTFRGPGGASQQPSGPLGPRDQKSQWNKAGAGRSDGMPAWQIKPMNGMGLMGFVYSY